MIIFDVNNDDSQSPLRCPHPAFLADDVLVNVRQLLSESSGIFVLNFASRDSTNQDRQECRTHLCANFDHLSAIKLDDDINEIMLASQQPLADLTSPVKPSKENFSVNFDVQQLLSKLKIEK